MMDDGMLDRIRTLARSLGIADIGTADAAAWGKDSITGSIPESERPSSLFSGARSVIVLGIPVQRAILATAPSVYYAEHYKTINSMLDHAAQRVTMELQLSGYASIPVARDGYRGIEGLRKDPSSFFSHRHAAYMAGMGMFGISNMLLTEKYGPRIRFVSVITDARLPCGSPLKGNLCTECMLCKEVCPSGAIGSVMYPEGITEKQRCVETSASLRQTGRSPCGRCIFVCPVGNDADGPLPSDGAIARIRSFS